MRRSIGARAIQHLPGAWISMVPEVLTGAPLEIVQPRLIGWRERQPAVRNGACPASRVRSHSQQRTEEELAPVDGIGSHRKAFATERTLLVRRPGCAGGQRRQAVGEDFV